MILTKKSMLKDCSFLPILLTSETMLFLPGYFLGRGRTLENLFVRFETTLDGAHFHEKNSAGNHCAFARQRFKHS